jgi:hypothetical protein
MSRLIFFSSFSLLFVMPLVGQAQILTGFSSRHSDAFVDWDLYVDSLDGSAGNLTMTWQHPDDWTQWSYRIGEHSGNIRTKWQKDFNQWEFRGDGKVVSAQTIWSGNFREWRLTNNQFSIELRCKFGNQSNDWLVDDGKRGYFRAYTQIETDPRDWIVEDELDPSVPLAMKMALVYLVIFSSVPK